MTTHGSKHLFFQLIFVSHYCCGRALYTWILYSEEELHGFRCEVDTLKLVMYVLLVRFALPAI